MLFALSDLVGGCIIHLHTVGHIIEVIGKEYGQAPRTVTIVCQGLVPVRPAVRPRYVHASNLHVIGHVDMEGEGVTCRTRIHAVVGVDDGIVVVGHIPHVLLPGLTHVRGGIVRIDVIVKDIRGVLHDYGLLVKATAYVAHADVGVVVRAVPEFQVDGGDSDIVRNGGIEGEALVGGGAPGGIVHYLGGIVVNNVADIHFPCLIPYRSTVVGRDIVVEHFGGVQDLDIRRVIVPHALFHGDVLVSSRTVPVIDVNVGNSYVVSDGCLEGEGIVRGSRTSRVVGYGWRVIIRDVAPVQSSGIVPIRDLIRR